ncbi:hypothetical protein [Nitrolancea hollandica]|uniref:Uncharacterized protein n=1 Tax=Nitrolancea hollandica Lb TaxID=1129897 RepID=I4EK65_9BACT|nr:hypothetical protein [Nitrolancea hollandica]CCF85077.1 exported hypothetical protein [Nitrolancea hollandica Lb]
MNAIRWIVAVLIVIAVCIAFWPFGLAILAPALIAGGIVARRQSRDPRLQALGTGAIAAGITSGMLVILLLGLIGFGLLKFSSGAATPGETIDTSTPVLVPVNPEK